MAEAHNSLGIVSLFYDWDVETAGRHFKRGINLNPSFPEGHLFYSWYLLLTGKADEALKEVDEAGALDPLSVIITTRRGSLRHYAGRNAEAIPFFKQALELDSTFWFARSNLAAALFEIGERDEARRIALSVRDVTGGNFESGLPAWILAQTGDVAEARARLRMLEERSRVKYVSMDGPAIICVGLGETDKALDILERAADDHAFTMILLPLYPQIRALRNDPRYKALLRRMGLPVS
jgi:hypothetical protein